MSASLSPIAASPMPEWPKRILLPRTLDAFTLAAWSRVCTHAGYEVLNESVVASADADFLLVVSADFNTTKIEAIVHQYHKAKNVHCVSSVIFTSADGPLGSFPSSLSAYRRLCAGVILCPTAVTPSQKRTLIMCIESLGGQLDGTYRSRQTTHLIAAKAMSDKYRAAKKEGRPILAPSWVEACFRHGRVDTHEAHQVPMLTGCVASCVALTADVSEAVREQVTAHGGRFVPYSPSVVATHFIAGYPLPEGFQSGSAHVVDRTWLDAFIRKPSELVPESSYPVRSPDESALAAAAAARLREVEMKQQEDKSAKEKVAAQKAEHDRARLLAEQQQAAEEAARLQADQDRAAADLARQQERENAENEVIYDRHNDMYLSGLRIFLLCLDSPAQVSQLTRIIQFGGGTRLQHLRGREAPLQAQANANCTDIVIVYGSCRREVVDEKVKAECESRTRGVDAIPFPVVNYRWLVDCYRQKSIVPFDGYQLPPPTVDTATTPAASTPTGAGLFTPRGPSPSLVRTASIGRPPLQRGSSTLRAIETSADLHETDATLDISGGHVEPEGPVNFSAFNQSLRTSSKLSSDPAAASFAQRSAAALSTVAAAVSAAHNNSSTASHRHITPAHPLPPPAPTTSSVLSKMAAAARVAPDNIFHQLRFVVEDEDEDPDAIADERKDAPPHLLPSLRFTTQRRLTVLKQLRDYGSTAIHEPAAVRSATFKKQLDFVIGSVCGSQRRTTRDFQASYGSNCQFASYLWVAACIKANRILSLPTPKDAMPNVCWDGRLPRLLTTTPPVSGFVALRITTSGFSSDESALLKSLLAHGGAEFTPGFNKDNTHVIYSDAVSKETSGDGKEAATAPNARKKINAAFHYSIPVVHGGWLIDCLERRQVSDERPYQLMPETSSRRRSSRQSTPPVAPDSPMLLAPDTPSVIVGDSASDQPKTEQRNTRRRSGEAHEGDKLESIVDDEDEEDDDLGFGQGLQSALQATPAVHTPLVRSKRARQAAARAEETLDTEHPPVDAASAHEVATPNSVFSVDAAGPSTTAADVAPVDADSSSSKLSAKAAFQQALKSGKLQTTKTKHAGTLTTVGEQTADDDRHEDEDEGEAEYTVDQAAASTKSPAPPAPVSPASVSHTPPFQKRKTRQSSVSASHASSPSAGPLSLATASNVVAPVLVGSSPKKFKKFQPARANQHAPAADDVNTRVSDGGGETTPVATKAHASAASTPSSTPASKPTTDDGSPAAKPKPTGRIRRRIHLSQDGDEPPAVDEPETEPETENNPEKEPEAIPAIPPPQPTHNKTTTTTTSTDAAEPVQTDATDAVSVARPSTARASRHSTRSNKATAASESVVDPPALQGCNSGVSATPTPDPKPTPTRFAKRTGPKPGAKTDQDDVVHGEEVTKMAAASKEEAGPGVPPAAEHSSPAKPAGTANSKTTVSPGGTKAYAAHLSPRLPPANSPARSSRTRPSSSRATAAPLLRSPSLGGFPEPSIDHPQPKKRLPSVKRTYGRIAATDGKENDDPFAFSDSEQEEETKTRQTRTRATTSEKRAKEEQDETAAAAIPYTETQVLSAQAPAIDDSEDAGEATPAPTAPTPVQTTGRAKRKAAAAAKSYAESDSESVPAAADEPAPVPVDAKPSKAARKPAASKRRKVLPTPAEESAEEAALSRVDITVTEFSVTPPPSPGAAHAAPVDDSAAPAASPLKRTISLSAVQSLTSLKHISADVEVADEVETETPPEDTSSKRKRRPTKKAAAAADATEMTEDAAEATVAEPATNEKNSRKRKAALKHDDSMVDDKADGRKKARAVTSKKTGLTAEEASAESTNAPSPPRSKRSKPSSASASQPLFTLTGVPTADKPRYTDIISSIGGCLVPDDQLDYRTLTHIICVADEKGLKRSEKVLVALMGPQYLLDVSFLDACKKAGAMVDEHPYEWIRHATAAGANEPMLPAIRKWHKGREQPYAGWRVATVGVEEGRMQVFRRLVDIGGGVVVPPTDTEVTHILIDTPYRTHGDLKRHAKDMLTAVQSILAAQSDPAHVVVARREYLVEHLVQAGEADVAEYAVTMPAARALSRPASVTATPTASPTTHTMRKASHAAKTDGDEETNEPAPARRRRR